MKIQNKLIIGLGIAMLMGLVCPLVTMEEQNYYKILGITKDASSEEIRKSYLSLSRVYHPDKGGNKEKFQKLVEAYEILGDPAQKETYDHVSRLFSTEGDMNAAILYFLNKDEEHRVTGTIHTNPILWLANDTNRKHIDFINRAYRKTIAGQDFIIDFPKNLAQIQPNETQEQTDGRIFFGFPEHVRKFVLKNLNIRK